MLINLEVTISKLFSQEMNLFKIFTKTVLIPTWPGSAGA